MRVIFSCDQRLLDGISDTTASSHAVVERGHKAVEQCLAVHVVWRSVRIIWSICCLVLGAEAFEGQESEDVDNDYQKGESWNQVLPLDLYDVKDVAQVLDLSDNIQ